MRSSLRGGGFWNLPNSLTVARCAAIPVIVVLLMFPTPRVCLIAMLVFVVASITDFIDGWLARRMGLVSTLGAFLDPLADKLLVMAAMVMMVKLGWLPGWIVVLFLAREITITGLRGIAASEGIIISAGKLGKYKTAFQDTGLAFMMYHYDWHGVNTHAVGLVLVWMALGYSLVSGWGYLRGFVKAAA